jgi:hypothetical protein
VRVFDHLNVVSRERGVDLAPGYEGGEVARSQLIELELSIRVRDKRTVQADQDFSFGVARQGS